MTIWSARTTYQGRAINQGTKQILDALNKMVRTPAFGGEKSDITMEQGGYNRGGVAASAGTHDGGGAFDLTEFNWGNRVRALRILGCAAWHRPYNWDNRSSGAHIHAIVCGDGTASAGAKSQVADFYGGRNGLANRAKDADWRPRTLPILFHLDGNLSKRYAKFACGVYAEPNAKGPAVVQAAVGDSFTPVAVVNVDGNYWFVTADGKCGYDDNFTTTPPTGTPDVTPKPPVVQPVPPTDPTPEVPVPPTKTFTIRAMTYNPSDKMGNTTERAKLVAEYVAKGDPDVVTFQELTGRDGPGDPSPWATRILDALGAKWRLIVPTTAFNENYIAYRVDRLSLVKQVPDHIMRVSGAAGKHCTTAVFKQIATGGRFVIGDAHLDPYTSVANRAKQCISANSYVKAVAVDEGSIPYLLCGDFNYEYLFADMKAINRLDVGHKARIKTGWKFSTFIGKTPTLDVGPHLDYITVGADAKVETAEVVQVLNQAGTKYKMPLAGDHIPKLATITYTLKAA